MADRDQILDEIQKRYVDVPECGECDSFREALNDAYNAGLAAAPQPAKETPHCWHCLDELIPELNLPRCNRCPAECDDENCTAEGCAREREARPGVCPSGRIEAQPVKAEQDERERAHLLEGARLLREVFTLYGGAIGPTVNQRAARAWLEAERARLSAAVEPATVAAQPNADSPRRP